MSTNVENISNIKIKPKPKLTKRTLKKSITLISTNNGNEQELKKNLLFNKELLKNIRKNPKTLNHLVIQQSSEEQGKAHLIMPVVQRTQTIGYRNVKLLRSFLTDYKKIKARRLTKLTLKQQRQLSRSVKRARMLKLFEPRKTLKPKKFLSLERKIETTRILLMLKVLKLNKFLEVINSIKFLKIDKTLKILELLKLLNRKNNFT